MKEGLLLGAPLLLRVSGEVEPGEREEGEGREADDIVETGEAVDFVSL